MKMGRGFVQKLHTARKSEGRKAVSPVIATLLLIAIAVAAGIILYVFVSGLVSSLSSVKGTVTQPLQVTIIKVSGSGGSDTITYQIVNPNGASVTGLTDIITDNNGVQVFSDTPSSCTPALPLASNSAATCTTGTASLSKGQTYRLTVIGTDANGNQYSSNPAPFTAK